MAIDRQTEALYRLAPFARTLEIELLVRTPTEVRARMPWSDARSTGGGILHGGAIMSLADTTGAVCAVENLPEGAAGTTTVESKTNFLRPVRNDYAEAVSRPLHRGRSFIVVETDVLDATGQLAARVTQTQAVLR